MADLLECLLQIKALKETPERVAALLHQAPPEAWNRRPQERTWAPIEVLAHLADVELVNAVRFRLMLTSDRPALPRFDQVALARRARYIDWPPAVALERFRNRRIESLEVLADCTADELSRTGTHPTRGEMSVADLIAMILAHDTDHVGQIRQRLGLAERPGAGEQSR